MTVEGKVSAKSSRMMFTTPDGGNKVTNLNPSQLKQVKDPWSRTQQPFDLAMNMRTVRMSVEEGGRDSVGMVTVNFPVNSSVIERNYMDNARALEILGRTFQNRDILSTLNYVIITAGSSPEGSEMVNEQLAARRALAVKSYIMWEYPYVDRDMIYTFSIGEDWDGLRRQVANDYMVPDRSEILSLLDSSVGNDAKKIALKKVAGGRAWAYISRYILPSLRGGAALYLHAKAESQPIVEPDKNVVTDEKPAIENKTVVDTVYVDRNKEQAPRVDTVKTIVRDTVYVDRVVAPKFIESTQKPLFAVKTNLLFDAATAINLEAEVPIGRRWSVAGEWIFPWWLLKNDQIALETGVATLEVRSYLGNRNAKQPLTGWFVGAHGGWGYYDLEWRDYGYQGELWYAGLSGGYAHTINRNGNLRMEYSLGFGYMHTDYTRYVPHKEGDNWYLVRQKEAKRLWIGPTRAKVSLVWMINYNIKKKGGVQ
jgi:hypothetical protein